MTDLNRSIKSPQLKMRMLNFTIDASSGTPVAGGFDEFGIASIIDLGVGNHTIIFDKPFERDCMVSGHSFMTANATLEVVAAAYDRVTVQTNVSDVAADTVFALQIIGTDARLKY